MQYTESTLSSGVNILRHADFVGEPVTLNFTSVETTDNGLKVVKAGTPIKSASGGWVASNDANATAILLHDVREDRPIGTGVVSGFINKAAAEASYGSTYSAQLAIKLVDIR